MESKKIFIVLPAYNEGTKLLSVIEDLKDNGFKNIIIVNDGSSDNTKDILEKTDVYHVSHEINRGAGAATQTGFELALILGADYVLTQDADGQHVSYDVQKLASEITKGQFDVIIGSRFLAKQRIPMIRRIFNKIGNFVTWFFFGTYVTDSQSGLKAFSKNALEQIKIESNGFEFCSEIIQKIHVNDLKYKEIPISVRYTEYSQSKGQNFFNGLRTVGKLALHSLIR